MELCTVDVFLLLCAALDSVGMGTDLPVAQSVCRLLAHHYRGVHVRGRQNGCPPLFSVPDPDSAPVVPCDAVYAAAGLVDNGGGSFPCDSRIAV